LQWGNLDPMDYQDRVAMVDGTWRCGGSTVVRGMGRIWQARSLGSRPRRNEVARQRVEGDGVKWNIIVT
jgi:hypothetical protein